MTKFIIDSGTWKCCKSYIPTVLVVAKWAHSPDGDSLHYWNEVSKQFRLIWCLFSIKSVRWINFQTGKSWKSLLKKRKRLLGLHGKKIVYCYSVTRWRLPARPMEPHRRVSWSVCGATAGSWNASWILNLGHDEDVLIWGTITSDIYIYIYIAYI